MEKSSAYDLVLIVPQGKPCEGTCNLSIDLREIIKGTLLDVYDQVHYVLEDAYEPAQGLHYTNNTSQYPFPNELWLVKPYWEIALKAAFFLPIVIGGLWGNGAVLNAIRTNQLLRGSPTNLFIANMALCDLCALLIGPWMLMCIDSFQNYVLGGFFCKTEGFLQSSLLLGGVLSLTAVSCDRLVAIVFPHRPRIGPCAAWTVVSFTWVVGISMSVPLVIYRHYNERQWCDFLECYCTENTDITSIYWMVIIALLVWCPLAVMLLSYTAIYCKLRRYTHATRKNNPVSSAARTALKARVTRMVLVLLLVFVICRVPFTALIYFRNAKLDSNSGHEITKAYRILWFVAHYLMYTNAALNPLIYGMNNEGFRSALRRPRACGGCPCAPPHQVNVAAPNNIAAKKDNKQGVKVAAAEGAQKNEAAEDTTSSSSPPALQPRDPYYLELNWRPRDSISPSPFTIKVTDP